MPRSMFVAAVVIASAAAAGFSAPALAAHEHHVPHPNLTVAQARAVAAKAFPSGKIMKAELEREGGGSGLRYSFDMRKGSSWREVGVDAMTGKVLENTHERANPTD